MCMNISRDLKIDDDFLYSKKINNFNTLNVIESTMF